MKPLHLVYLTSVAVTSFQSFAAEALAQVACGSVITQNTKLSGDLTNCPANGIVIGASGITLDLGGYTIDGAGAGAGNGVDNTAGYTGVIIKNGRIREFTTGVNLENATENRVRDLWVADNDDGIFLLDSDDNVLEGNIVSDSSISGITLTGMVDGSDDNQIARNVSVENEFFGLAIENQ
jgi:large repetitive protein